MIVNGVISDALAQGPGQLSTDTFKASSLDFACTRGGREGSPHDREIAEQTCIAYLRGLSDGLFVMQLVASRGKRVCLPNETPVPILDTRRIFQQYLTNHPKEAVNSATVVVSFALFEAYKCNQ
jgi:hypothetical protein